MVLKNLILAESVNISPGGGRDLIGITPEIAADGFPCRHPSIVAFAQIVGEKNERKDFKVEFVLVDEKYSEVCRTSPYDCPAKDSPLEPVSEEFTVNIVFTIDNISFPEAGVYQLLLIVDGRTLGSTRLRAFYNPRIRR